MNLLKFSFSSDWPNLLSSSVPQMYLYRNTRLCFGTPSLVQPQKIQSVTMKQINFKLFNVPNILEICSPQKLLNNKL